MRALLAAQAFARREAAAMGRRPLGGVTAEEEGSRIELRLGLSDTLQAQSRLPEAEVLIVAALQWRERHLGAQAAETLATCFDLARCKRRAAREAPSGEVAASCAPFPPLTGHSNDARPRRPHPRLAVVLLLVHFNQLNHDVVWKLGLGFGP